ncbi:MAG: c-type cytochrome [Anaerolineales bacterium]|jgi:mono/diheme cytochrome c family protein
MKSLSNYRIFIYLILLFLMSSCMSLAQDVTPPPGYSSPAVQQVTKTSNGPMYPLARPDPLRGEQIFAEKCAPCHGQEGLGDGPQADELPNSVPPIGAAEIARQTSPAHWYSVITQGNLERFMPPFSSLSDRQRWDVVAYLYTLSAPSSTIVQGEELYLENCASCHGDKGQGDGAQADELNQPLPDFSDQAFMAEKSAAEMFQVISEGGVQMPTFNQLSEEERWTLTAYLRSLTFEISSQTASPTSLEEQEGQVSPTPVEGSTAEPTEVLTPTLGVGDVSVEVINGSGGELPTDLSVVLYGYDDMTEVFSQTVSVGAQGTASFIDVPMPLNRVFLATLDYEGATYGSDIALVEAETKRILLGITLFETTTDSSVLSVDRLHVFFEFPDSERLQVVELFVISNSSDKTVVPPEEGAATISFALPEEASNLRFQDGTLGGRFVETANGFGDTAYIRPGSGEYQVMFAFEMPYERNRTELQQTLNLPTNALIVMAPEQGVKVRSERLQDAGTREVEGVAFSMFEGDRLNAGENLSISVSGKPKRGGSLFLEGDEASTNLVIGLGAFGVVLIAAGILLYRRNRQTEEYEPAHDEELEVESDADELIDAIIALDDLFEAGDLPEEAYRRRRAELKARLKDLTK